MYGELRTALNNVASQFSAIALQLEERRAYETLFKLRLGLDVTVFAIESAYKALRKYNCLVQTMLNSEAA